MLSIFNVMAAERYRLRIGFWPLFFTAATVAIVLVRTWAKLVSFPPEEGSFGIADAMFSWIGTSSLVLGVVICYSLLRSPITSSDSNYLRLRSDRLVYAISHALIALAINVGVCSLGVCLGLVTCAYLGMPLAATTTDVIAWLVWIFQASLATWVMCLSGLCVGYASRNSGVATVVVALAAFGVPGDILALPCRAWGCEAVGHWFATSQPYRWIVVLARGELLGSTALVMLTLSCVALLALLSVISVCRKLK